MSQPTREEVAESYKRVTDTLCTVYAQANLDVLWNAYLAQGEELEQVNNTLRLLMRVDKEQREAVESLKAENQALKRKGELLCCQCGVLEMENQELKASMEAGYIERQAKHIQALVKENEALKAGSLRLEA